MEANPIYRGRPDIDGDVVMPPESEKMPFIKRMEMDYFSETVPRGCCSLRGCSMLR